MGHSLEIMSQLEVPMWLFYSVDKYPHLCIDVYFYICTDRPIYGVMRTGRLDEMYREMAKNHKRCPDSIRRIPLQFLRGSDIFLL